MRYATGRQLHCMRIAKTVLFPRDTTNECTNIWDDGGRVTFADSHETSDYVTQCIWRIFRDMLLRIFLGTLLGIFKLSPVQISSYASPVYPHANINISASGKLTHFWNQRKITDFMPILNYLKKILFKPLLRKLFSFLSPKLTSGQEDISKKSKNRLQLMHCQRKLIKHIKQSLTRPNQTEIFQTEPITKRLRVVDFLIFWTFKIYLTTESGWQKSCKTKVEKVFLPYFHVFLHGNEFF
jgi:hypothetical protein